MIKKILTVMLAIIITIGVGGCAAAKKESAKSETVYTPEVKKEKALAYLKEKYSEEFIPISMNESGWGQGHDEIYFYPQNGTKEDKFSVYGTIKDDGTYALRDGYFGIIIKDKYEAVMSGFVKDIYKDFKIVTSISGSVLPDRLNKDTKISEIYNIDDSVFSYTTVFVKQSTAEKINVKDSLKKIAQKMIDNKLVGSVRIYTVFDEKYDSIDPDVTSISLMAEKNYFVSDYTRIAVDSNLKIYGEE